MEKLDNFLNRMHSSAELFALSRKEPLMSITPTSNVRNGSVYLTLRVMFTDPYIHLNVYSTGK